MTAAAKHYGKQLVHFWSKTETDYYLLALGQAQGLIHRNSDELDPSLVRDAQDALTDRTVGRYGGTWAHPKLAVFFARWLDVRFAVWCDSMIDDILKGAAQVTITKPKESAVMGLPGDYAPQFLPQTFSRSFDSSTGCQFPPLPGPATPSVAPCGRF